MHVCLRSLRGEREFAQALFFERVREATDSHDVLQPQVTAQLLVGPKRFERQEQVTTNRREERLELFDSFSGGRALLLYQDLALGLQMVPLLDVVYVTMDDRPG